MPDPAYHPLVRSISRSLRRRCGVTEGDRLLVAVSGGADSVALLRAIAGLAPRRRWRLNLAVGHVQHHLRDDAENDAKFVETMAEQLGLSFERRDLSLHNAAPHKHAEPANLEARARLARYDALRDMALATDCRHVVTAHHADDQLETILMRMMRGTGVAGLRGIAWRRDLSEDVALIRPMLDSTHADAIDFLNLLDQPWREDHTNRDITRTRARLRRDVLPVLRDLCPSVARKAMELGDTMRETHKAIDEIETKKPRD